MKPVVNELNTIFGNEIDFVAYNIDLDSSTQAEIQYNFRYQPYFVLADADGNIIQTWNGPVNRDQFIMAFENALQ